MYWRKTYQIKKYLKKFLCVFINLNQSFVHPPVTNIVWLLKCTHAYFLHLLCCIMLLHQCYNILMFFKDWDHYIIKVIKFTLFPVSLVPSNGDFTKNLKLHSLVYFWPLGGSRTTWKHNIDSSSPYKIALANVLYMS